MVWSSLVTYRTAAKVRQLLHNVKGMLLLHDVHLNSLWLDNRLLIGAANLSKTKDESVVIISKTQKLLDSLDVCGCFPIRNCSNLILGPHIPPLSLQYGQDTLHVVF